MAKRLFVGGLSWGTDDEGLRAAFASFGDIDDAKVIMDRDTGRSRGFGFVTLADDGAALRAIEEMDGSMLDGRSIRVNEAQERERRGGGPMMGGGGGGGFRDGGDRGGERRGGGGRRGGGNDRRGGGGGGRRY